MKIPRFLAVALAIGLAFVVQAIGYAISEDIGDLATLASIAIVAAGCWVMGRMFSRRFALLALLLGAALGGAYWLVDWQFMRFFRVDVLHQFSERNITWIAGLYALLMWPTILLCGAVAGVASWRNMSRASLT